jgi:hypothetical protein
LGFILVCKLLSSLDHALNVLLRQVGCCWWMMASYWVIFPMAKQLTLMGWWLTKESQGFGRQSVRSIRAAQMDLGSAVCRMEIGCCTIYCAWLRNGLAEARVVAGYFVRPDPAFLYVITELRVATKTVSCQYYSISYINTWLDSPAEAASLKCHLDRQVFCMERY